MLDCFLARAAALPDAPLFWWADAQGKVVERVSRHEAFRRAAAIAAKLRADRRLAPGDRVLLVYPPGLQFNWALLGCQAAGLVPVPVYPPRPNATDEDLARLARIAQDAGCKAALTDVSYRWILRWIHFKGLFSGKALPALAWIVTGSEAADTPLVAGEVAPTALIQYTSGSTGEPRGVAISWANLEHQLAINARALGFDASSRLVMWVPQYHDLGLISGIMSAVHGNGVLIQASPLAFLARPALWLDLVSQHQATHTAAPNFGFGLVLRRTAPEERASWRLGSLKVLMSAAEPIDGELMDRFLAELGPAGLAAEAFCPAYGLAEHTVGVTMGGKARLVCSRAGLEQERVARVPAADERAVTMVGCGTPAPDVAVRIVREGAALAEGHVGEIWVQSPSVAAGYHGREAETAATFGAQLPEGGRWLRTGDLGFLHGGELFVAGRLKDLIIVGGRNVYPQDVEAAAAAAAPDVRPGCVAAFAVPGRDTDAVALVADLREGADAEAVAQAIREGVGRRLGLPLAQVALGSRGLVPKTTSGKVRRRATATALADGSLQRSPAWLGSWEAPAGGEVYGAVEAAGGQAEAIFRLAPEAREAAMAALLDEVWAAFPGGQPLVPTEPFAAQGVDSLAAVEFIARLERALGQEVTPLELLTHATPGRLAAHLARRLEHAEADASRQLAAPPWAPHARRPGLDEPVAVIGAGAAGLVAADELTRLGYRNVTIFEAGTEPGGKVLTVNVDGAPFELGAVYVGAGYEEVVGLARRLGLALEPAVGDAWLVDRETAVDQEGGAAWIGRMLEAAGGPVQGAWASGLGDRDPALARPLATWLAAAGLGEPPALVRLLWTSFGYGPIDDAAPAHQFVEYFRSGIGRLNLPLQVAGGNQGLWKALAAHLQAAGVTIRYGTPVRQVAGTQVDGQPFAAVVLTCSPAIGARLLPAGHPVAPLLGRFRERLYRASLVRLQGPRSAPDLVMSGDVLEGSRPGDPSVVTIGRTVRASDLWVAYQFQDGADGAPLPEALMAEALERDLAAMGRPLQELLLTRTWPYAPYLTSEDAGTWLELQALQGDGGLWLAGGALGFETMEHAARHARELVRLGFTPAEPLEVPLPTRRLEGGRPLPAPMSVGWALGFLEGRLSAHENLAAIVRVAGRPERMLPILAHLDAVYEGLRVRYGPGPVAWVEDGPAPAVPVRELASEAELQAWCRAEAGTPFTAEDARLYRAGLAVLPRGGLALWLVVHHAILDAGGIGAVLAALASLWETGPGPVEAGGGTSVLEEVVQQELRRAAGNGAAVAFWRQRLAERAASWTGVEEAEGPMIEHMEPLGQGVARRLAMVAARRGRPVMGFLAEAAARVGGGSCFAMVTNGFAGRVLAPRPPQAIFVPLWPGDDVEETLRNFVDQETFGALCQEAGLAGVPWRWSINHVELPSRVGALAVEPVPRPRTRLELEVATVVDPATGRTFLRLQGRSPDHDAAGLAAIAAALARELAALTTPEALWERGVGFLG